MAFNIGKYFRKCKPEKKRIQTIIIITFKKMSGNLPRKQIISKRNNIYFYYKIIVLRLHQRVIFKIQFFQVEPANGPQFLPVF